MDTVIINDVGPRDGLQNDAATVAPHDRAALVNALVDALAHLGVTHIDMPATPESVWRAVQASGADIIT